MAIYFRQKLQRLFLSVNVLKTYLMQASSKVPNILSLEESQTFQNSPFNIAEQKMTDSHDEQALKVKRIKTLCDLTSS